MAQNDPRLSWHLLGFILLFLAADAVHWLVTPASHPGAPAVQTVLALVQAVGGAGAAFWAWHRGSRAAAH